MILLWGLEADSPLSAVRARLEEVGAPTVFVDQRKVVGARLDDGRLQLSNGTVDLAQITAAYVRPYDSSKLPVVARAGEAARRRVAAFEEGLWAWAEASPALVVNRPSAMAYNDSKPYQVNQARSLGFTVPETLLTTDPAAVQKFLAEHGDIIYKSISAIRSVVTRLRPSDLDRLGDVASCPTQFQAYVPGTDHRVHVVGDAVYCCRIESTADDYRYATREATVVERHPAALPAEWADRCRALARLEGLYVAGVDLRLTPAGNWCCFEINPSPAFTYYDDPRHEIARAVADLLITAPGPALNSVIETPGCGIRSVRHRLRVARQGCQYPMSVWNWPPVSRLPAVIPRLTTDP